MANFKDILDMMISDGEDLLAEAEQKMGEDVAARTDSLLLTGTNPATEIVKLIGQRDYDLLIVGNRGLSGSRIHGQRQPQAVARIAHPRADREITFRTRNGPGQ